MAPTYGPRSTSSPLTGPLLSDQHVSTHANVFLSPGGSNGGEVLVSRHVEGVVIKALAANTGTIYITEKGKTGTTHGFPLAKSETISIGTDDLANVEVWVPTSGDGFAYLAIGQ